MTVLTKTEIAVVHGGLGLPEALAYTGLVTACTSFVGTLFSSARWCANDHQLHKTIAFFVGVIGTFYFAN